MSAPSASALLDLWDRARTCDPPTRALHLLATAMPDVEAEALADLDLGQRDWYLLRLRQAVFGPHVQGRGICPHCGTEIETDFDVRRVLADSPPPPSCFIDHAGRRFRLPTGRDLAAIARLTDYGRAERVLLQRCADDPAAGADPDEVDRGLSALAAERQLRLSLECDVCKGGWTIDFDPVAFLWEEVDACVQNLLDDVHRLACAYGWSEQQILALGESRRAAYLERVG